VRHAIVCQATDKQQRLIDLIPRLRRYARALLGEAAAADGLVQRTLAHASSALDLFPEEGELRAWVFAMMHDIYVNEMRARHAGDPDEEHDADPAAGAPLGGPLLLRDLERALAKLGAEQRSVLLLVTLEGMNYDEVARVLGISIGTVIARLSRARRKLRALVLADRKLTVVK
jgi:RNA polymerase sigma-70 factor, ECF subfamily